MASEFYLPVAIAIASTMIYPLYLAITRLYFSPISHIPGPKFVVMSGWVEFYFDFFKGGKYIFEIEKMHRKYGKYSSSSQARCHSNSCGKARSFALIQKRYL
jgi:hypothetical protein